MIYGELQSKYAKGRLDPMLTIKSKLWSVLSDCPFITKPRESHSLGHTTRDCLFSTPPSLFSFMYPRSSMWLFYFINTLRIFYNVVWLFWAPTLPPFVTYPISIPFSFLLYSWPPINLLLTCEAWARSLFKHLNVVTWKVPSLSQGLLDFKLQNSHSEKNMRKPEQLNVEASADNCRVLSQFSSLATHRE